MAFRKPPYQRRGVREVGGMKKRKYRYQIIKCADGLFELSWEHGVTSYHKTREDAEKAVIRKQQ